MRELIKKLESTEDDYHVRNDDLRVWERELMPELVRQLKSDKNFVSVEEGDEPGSEVITVKELGRDVREWVARVASSYGEQFHVFFDGKTVTVTVTER